MQRNRKMTLNEEFALMRKMFHKMGVTEVLKENKIRLNESLGGPPPTVLDGLTPGSSVAIIGKTVLPEIESAILMSAKNSDLIKIEEHETLRVEQVNRGNEMNRRSSCVPRIITRTARWSPIPTVPACGAPPGSTFVDLFGISRAVISAVDVAPEGDMDT